MTILPTQGMDQFMPTSELKKLPSTVTFRIKGSEFAIKGQVTTWTQMILSEETVMTRSWTESETFSGRLNERWFAGLPSDVTFLVVGNDDHWRIKLIGVDWHTFEVSDVVIERDDQKFWSYVMTSVDSDHLIPDYELLFSRGWGYLAPIFKLVRGTDSKLIHGRRPIALEAVSAGNYIGSVTPGVSFLDQWKILTEPDKNIGDMLQGVPTRRAVRFNSMKPDRPDPIEHGVAQGLEVVDLMPSLIASGNSAEKARVKNLINIYAPGFVPADGKIFVPFADYMEYGDQPGLAALYQWMCWQFTEYLGNLPGMNTEAANVVVDRSESFGPIQRIGLLQRSGTWLVIHDKMKKGRFARDGAPLSAITASSFDPSTVAADPKLVHTLFPINPNNKRLAGTNTVAGLMPVEVYQYGPEVSSKGLKAETLCDFAKSGDATSQAALAMWIWHMYGPVLSTLRQTNS